MVFACTGFGVKLMLQKQNWEAYVNRKREGKAINNSKIYNTSGMKSEKMRK